MSHENPLAKHDALRNRYFGLRHGESEANLAQIVLSDPAVGTVRYGLSERGRAQVRESVAAAAGLLGPGVRVLSSDFTRTRETAELAVEVLKASGGAGEVELKVALRERFFGAWEGTSNENYQRVWARDAEDPEHTEQGVESAAAVVERVAGLVAGLEAEREGRTFLLVSHGDALQLLQTAFLRLSPATHRQRDHWAPAEVRALELGGEPGE